MKHSVVFWISFHVLILILLLIDLKGFHRKSAKIDKSQALWMTVIWIVLAMGFNLCVYVFLGAEAGLQFFTGYLIEKSLSVDNLFVFLLIFTYFKIASHLQHKILYWGIIGAIVFRIVLILAGVKLIQEFDWVTYLLGAFLVFTGIKLVLDFNKQFRPEQNVLVRVVRKFLPLSTRKGPKTFFVREKGRWMMTSLFLVPLTIETTDIIFALDSIPAVFAVTKDPFIIYTSNIFAILGLRSLYFVLSGYFYKLRFFKYGLAAILVFVGTKMVIAKWYEIPLPLSLGVVGLILALTVGISLILKAKRN